MLRSAGITKAAPGRTREPEIGSEWEGGRLAVRLGSIACQLTSLSPRSSVWQLVGTLDGLSLHFSNCANHFCSRPREASIARSHAQRVPWLFASFSCLSLRRPREAIIAAARKAQHSDGSSSSAAARPELLRISRGTQRAIGATRLAQRACCLHYATLHPRSVYPPSSTYRAHIALSTAAGSLMITSPPHTRVELCALYAVGLFHAVLRFFSKCSAGSLMIATASAYPL